VARKRVAGSRVQNHTNALIRPQHLTHVRHSCVIIQAWACWTDFFKINIGGGCTFPLFHESPSGRDCSAIPGVASVMCYRSKCAVRACLMGWEVSEDGQSCWPGLKS